MNDFQVPNIDTKTITESLDSNDEIDEEVDQLPSSAKQSAQNYKRV